MSEYILASQTDGNEAYQPPESFKESVEEFVEVQKLIFQMFTGQLDDTVPESSDIADSGQNDLTSQPVTMLLKILNEIQTHEPEGAISFIDDIFQEGGRAALIDKIMQALPMLLIGDNEQGIEPEVFTSIGIPQESAKLASDIVTKLIKNSVPKREAFEQTVEVFLKGSDSISSPFSGLENGGWSGAHDALESFEDQVIGDMNIGPRVWNTFQEGFAEFSERMKE